MEILAYSVVCLLMIGLATIAMAENYIEHEGE